MLPQEQRSVMRLVRSIEQARELRRATASQLLGAVLHAWQQQTFPALIRAARRAPNYSASDSVRQFASLLAALPLFEAAFWLSSAYAHWVGSDVRASKAMFFTPPELANRLIDDLIAKGASLTTHRWADPACGGAAFLAPVAARMAAELKREGKTPDQVLRHIERHLFGNELDQTLAELSVQFLRMALSEEIAEAGFEPSWKVTVGNALSALSDWNGQTEVVVCNPPYRKMPRGEVDPYRTAYQDVIESQPNIYGLFFKRVLDLLAPGGLSGFVTPTSFLSGQSFSKLRTTLLANADTLQLSLVTEREGVFVGVEQEVAMTVLRKHEAAKPRPSDTRVFVYRSDLHFVDIGRCHLPNSGLAWPVPRTSEDAETLRLLSASRFRLADYGFRPRIGWYVDYRDKNEFRIASKPGQATRNSRFLPLVWSSDIGPAGQFALNRLGAKGHMGFIQLPHKQVAGIHKKPALLLQRVTSPDQPKRLVGAAVPAALLNSGWVAENHVIVIEQVEPGPIGPDKLRLLLQSDAVDRYFRCISGAVNVSAFELEQLPLPDPQRLRAALESGLQMETAVSTAFSLAKSQ